MASRRRTKRVRHCPLVLTARDRTVLACIGVMRYMSADQLAREYFPSVDRCRRRLRQLYDARLVAVTLAASNASNVVSLTSDGVRVVSETDPDLAASMRLPGTLRVAGMAHHLGLVDVRLYTAALAVRGGMKLRSWRNAETDAVTRVRSPKGRLVSDARAELVVAGEAHMLAVEYDTGTEVLATLKRKCEGMADAFDAGDVDELWVVVDAGHERLDHIRALVRAAGIGEFTRVMDRAFITRRPVQQPSAVVGGGGRVEDPIPVSKQDALHSLDQQVVAHSPNADRTALRGAVR